MKPKFFKALPGATLLLSALLGGCAALSPTAAPSQEALLPAGWDAAVAGNRDVNDLAWRYLQLSLATNPTLSAQLGLAGTDSDPTLYARSLPDISPQALNRAHQRLSALREALMALEPASLSPEEQVDRRILLSKIGLDLLSLGALGEARNPLKAIGMLGEAYSGLLVRESAPLGQRLRSLHSRCRATPAYLAQLQQNFSPETVRPTGPQKQLVSPRLQGLASETGMLRKLAPELAAQAQLTFGHRRTLAADCAAAADAIQAFDSWFQESVAPRPDSDWRLGPGLYQRKYALYMDYPLGPQELLATAQRSLRERHAALVQVARRIHDRYLAEAIAAGQQRKAARLGDAQVVRNVLAKMAEDRPTVDSLIADSYALADSIVSFVEEQDLLDLPPTAKLRIEPIPPHLSGYAVAMIQTAPPFQPELDSVWFWDLPLLRQSEGFLKEYNRPALAEVYIHEGVPGHFVQLEYSNRAERLVPRVLWNGPMVEGWASYIQSQLVDAGYTVYPDHPLGHELQRIANLKLGLRSVINAIIDIRLHTTNWSEEAALKLMLDKGFQEEAEARGKLQRAKLSSVQLASYFAGEHAIREILTEYRRQAGDDFSWKRFNERLLGAGSPPMEVVRQHMLGEPD